MNKKIVVQKYGGTSIGDVEKLKLIAKKIVDKKTEGFSPVVVVSAMGKTTDELVDMSEKVTFNKVKPDLREKDTLLSTGELVSATLLAMSIKSLNAIVNAEEKLAISSVLTLVTASWNSLRFSGVAC